MTLSPGGSYTLSSPFAWDTSGDRENGNSGAAHAKARRVVSSSSLTQVEGSTPRWYLPGRAHVQQPYDNHISQGLSEFIQNRTAKKPGSAGFGGSRRHFPSIQTPTQREPQLSTANNVDYYKRVEGSAVSNGSSGSGSYRRHLGYVVPPKPVEKVQRLKHIMPASSGGVFGDSNSSSKRSTSTGGDGRPKQVRFLGGTTEKSTGLNSFHSSPSYPEPNLPRLGRKSRSIETAVMRREQTLADTLGRRVKVNTKDFKNSDRAGAQRILRGTPSRVEEEVSLSGESFFGRKVDLITFKRFVSNLAPSTKVPLMESLKMSSRRQKMREIDNEAKAVQDLDNWKHTI